MIYMKHIKSIKGILAAGICVSVAAMLTGCAKELNQTPQSTANNAAIFGSLQGLQLYSASFYDGLTTAANAVRGDDQYGDADYGARNTIPLYLQDSTFTSQQASQSSDWNWKPLRNINYFIENVSIPNPAISTTVQQNYIGLARFFRAYFYFNMVAKFGNVPWIGKALGTTDSALYSAQTDRTVVIDSVLADLDYAAQHISMTTDPTASQITKWAAYGLKSRVCLFEGTFREYQTKYNLGGTVGDLLTQGAGAAKAVMDSGGYSLNTAGGPAAAYRNLFISTSPLANEVMLSDVMSASLSVYNDANWYFTSSSYGTHYSLTRGFVDTYLNADGSVYATNDTATFQQETANRDPRLAQTIRTPGYQRVNVDAPPNFSYTVTGYMPLKWTLDNPSFDQSTDNTNSICLMRYAEILLNYAEAEEELKNYGGPGLTGADWTKTIGALRTRAGLSGALTIPATLDPSIQSYYSPKASDMYGALTITDPVLLEIRRERGIELVLEGFRFNDLTRWRLGTLLARPWDGIYVPAVNTNIDLDGDGTPDVCFYNTPAPPGAVGGVSYVPIGGTNGTALSNGTSGRIYYLNNGHRVWNDYKYLYPIPFSEEQLNPNLVQNPGWN
jgi:starch-binding outer membrane protein, SusD/RagB family